MSRVDMKVVLLGKEYSGKTSIVERYLYNRFQGQVTYQATIGAAYGAKKIDVSGKSITMGIWDTAGSERYESMSRIYYRSAQAAIVCYDVTDKESFGRVKFWVNELRLNEEQCRIYLCGTKLDLAADKSSRQVDIHNVHDYAEEINAEVYETSSKTGENIENLFYKIAEDFAKSPILLSDEDDPTKFKLEGDNTKSRCSCR